MAEKISVIFTNSEQYYLDSFKLTLQILSSGFVPDVICAIVRGGCTPANVFSDVLKSLDIPSKYVSAFLKSYNKNKPDEYVKIEGYTLQPEDFWPDCKVLGLDDVFDSGNSQGVFVADIHDRNPTIKLENIKFGVLDYKTSLDYMPPDIIKFRRLYDRENPDRIYELPNLLKSPSYYVNKYHSPTRKNNPWLWYPHETEKHTIKEIESNMGKNIGAIVEEIRSLNLKK